MGDILVLAGVGFKAAPILIFRPLISFSYITLGQNSANIVEQTSYALGEKLEGKYDYAFCCSHLASRSASLCRPTLTISGNGGGLLRVMHTSQLRQRLAGHTEWNAIVQLCEKIRGLSV